MIADLVFSVLLAVVVSAGFALLIGRQGPWRPLVSSFALVFLGTWAGGVWGRSLFFTPKESARIPFVVAGTIAALLVNGLQPRYRRLRRDRTLSRNETIEMLDRIGERRESSRLSLLVVNGLFWIVMIALLFSIGLRYVRDAARMLP